MALYYCARPEKGQDNCPSLCLPLTS